MKIIIQIKSAVVGNREVQKKTRPEACAFHAIRHGLQEPFSGGVLSGNGRIKQFVEIPGGFSVEHGPHAKSEGLQTFRDFPGHRIKRLLRFLKLDL
ncbi:MAG: hypothetical protein BWY42_01757 [Candidatus Omnitrophica bacterium ADurb.Bin277]|nr:MAG: hypothetical protein BWY42_01757 [Candidatus Omnitrophica bacterium ADurb.Bin277]